MEQLLHLSKLKELLANSGNPNAVIGLNQGSLIVRAVQFGNNNCNANRICELIETGNSPTSDHDLLYLFYSAVFAYGTMNFIESERVFLYNVAENGQQSTLLAHENNLVMNLDVMTLFNVVDFSNVTYTFSGYIIIPDPNYVSPI